MTLSSVHTAAVPAVQPLAFGRPRGERAAWGMRAESAAGQACIAEATRLAAAPAPEVSDELYLHFSRTGIRTVWEDAATHVFLCLRLFTLAECLEGQGRFLAPLEGVIRQVCAWRTWVMPAHDQELKNFHGEITDIDLGASRIAWELAHVRALLSDVLPADLITLIDEHLHARIFAPFRAVVAADPGPGPLAGPRGLCWWLHTTNNWNAVCLAGVTGAALAALPSADDRAWFVRTACRYVTMFLDGFTPDGYCSEGMTYWNYGFGHFVVLSESIRRATNGACEPLADPRAAAPAAFAARCALAPHCYPAFADCNMGVDAAEYAQRYLLHRFGRAALTDTTLQPERLLNPAAMFNVPLVLFLMQWWPEDWPAVPLVSSVPWDGNTARSWFADAQVLVCRSGPRRTVRLAAAMKGGHNDEHHNHNDLGSYVVALDGRVLLADPGREIYTARTFSEQRYTSPLLNSYGHPVPVVAGTLQRAGAAARAHVLVAEFTDERDLLRLDLRAAYDVPQLVQLERTFTFVRAGGGLFSVCDDVRFTAPCAFETALITYAAWRRAGASGLEIFDDRGVLRIAIDTGDIPWELRAETLNAVTPHGGQPTRLGIVLAQPVQQARVGVHIQPAKL